MLAGILQPVAVPATDWVYTFADGDSLWNISERFLDSPLRYEQLRRLNNVEFPKEMRPGARVRIPMRWIRDNPVPAKITALHGTVELLRVDGQTAPSPAPGTLIRLGDRIRTGSHSSVAIGFADGSAVTLHSDGEMRFDHLRAHGETGMVDSRLHLIDGRLDSRIKPAVGPGSRFQIETPSAVSAVRGTQYRAAVRDSDNASNIEVIEGKVRVEGANTARLVPEGFGTQVAPGRPPVKPRPLLAPPRLEPLPTPIRELNFPLSWGAIDAAAAYRVELSRALDFETLLFDAVTGRTSQPLPDLPDGRYQVRVRGIDDLDLEGRSAHLTILLDAHPQPPVALNPVDQATLRGRPAELQWTASADAARYRLEVARDPDFKDRVLLEEGLDGTRYATAEITQPGSYHWRLTSIAEDGEVGPPGISRVWHLKPIPEKVEASLGAADGKLVASWPPGRTAREYQVQLAYDRQFTDLEVDQTVTEPVLQFQPLAGQVRYLRVRAVEPDGYLGPWGTVQRVDPPPDRTAWLIPVLGILGLLLL